ncbi:MAG: hypothetical protein B6D61_13530 [Bacteroidetes bacterium 4484_249]|nr:MAG: hypothetical protein B6D61_13530 [Bacteroidetes bacterium 4484_249]
MKIVNPLYDKAFKYLMENERIAKKVLSVILDQEVMELTVGQQETIVPDEKRNFTLFRLDFVAVIKEKDGSRKKVLIELQKSKYPTDILRFRTYLGMNYAKADKVIKTGTRTVKETYPIITIYILGYNLDDLPYMAVTVNRRVINSVNKKPVKVKSFFIEQLTHRSHIIQVLRLPEKRRTKLEKFLTLFNQAWITEDRYILDLRDVPKEFEDVAKYLEGAAMDETFRRQLEAEEEIDNLFDEQEEKFLKQIEKLKQRERDAKQREEEERRQKEEERKKVILIIKNLVKTGMSLEDVSKITKKSIEEIKEIVNGS